MLQSWLFQANALTTPSPSIMQRFVTSGEEGTPHVVGVRNPATAFKESKAVKLRHTPFAERCACPYQTLLAMRIAQDQFIGRKTMGLGHFPHAGMGLNAACMGCHAGWRGRWRRSRRSPRS